MRDAIQEDGILWHDGKSKTKPPILIEWTPELRAIIDEALAASRYSGADCGPFIFGNMKGQRYSKSGWKCILGSLMDDCVKEAEAAGIPFRPFSLQDCRPKGVSDKLADGQTDTQDVTGHASGKMIAQVYDRRLVKKGKPVR